MIQNLENVEDRVFVLLKKDEDCRNNDNYLIFKYWVEIDNLDTANISLDMIKRLTPSESIRRASRKLIALAIANPKELGFLLPTDPEVRLKRAIAEDAYKKWVRQNG